MALLCARLVSRPTIDFSNGRDVERTQHAVVVVLWIAIVHDRARIVGCQKKIPAWPLLQLLAFSGCVKPVLLMRKPKRMAEVMDKRCP